MHRARANKGHSHRAHSSVGLRECLKVKEVNVVNVLDSIYTVETEAKLDATYVDVNSKRHSCHRNAR